MSRRMLSPTTLVLTVAFTLAVGSLAGAAGAAKLITGADVRNGSLTGADLKAKSIPGAKLKDRAIQQKQLSLPLRAKLNAPGPQGPQGLPGTQGPQGPQGPSGAAGATSVKIRISATVSVAAGMIGATGVDCSAGEVATGGGVSSAGIAVGESYPTLSYNQTAPSAGATPTGWRVSGRNTTANPIAMTAYVVCATP